MKTKYLLLTCLMATFLMTSCVKESQTTCRTCKAKNNVGTVMHEKTVCSESEESSFRDENSNYNVTCD